MTFPRLTSPEPHVQAGLDTGYAIADGKARKAISWASMVNDPMRGGMTILANQIADRDAFLADRGLTDEFRAWLKDHPWTTPIPADEFSPRKRT